jgi:hypothetical protein
LPNKQWFVSNGTCESFDTSNLKRDIAKLFPPEEKTPSSQGVFFMGYQNQIYQFYIREKE